MFGFEGAKEVTEMSQTDFEAELDQMLAEGEDYFVEAVLYLNWTRELLMGAFLDQLDQSNKTYKLGRFEFSASEVIANDIYAKEMLFSDWAEAKTAEELKNLISQRLEAWEESLEERAEDRLISDFLGK